MNSEMLVEKEAIIQTYLLLCNELHKFPTIKDVKAAGVRISRINKFFGSIQYLKFYIKNERRELLNEVYDLEELTCEVKLRQTKKNIKSFNRFVVSSIGTGRVDSRFLASIYNYCKRNKARLLLIPTDMKIDSIDPSILKEYVAGKLDIIFEDIELCKNLNINSLKINEKVVNPTAGISRYQKDNSSFIYASPKQTTTSVGVKKRGYPRLRFSPGAITQASYIEDPLLKKKRSVMADNDHLMGALIVEIEGSLFFERKVQMHIDGSFPDMGVRYLSNGKYEIDSPEAFIMGDLHSAEKHEECFQAWLDIIKELNIGNVVLHDVFDCKSLNPHEKDRATKTLSLTIENKQLLSDEIKLLNEDLNRVSKVTNNTYVVDSNHDDMLQRAFDSGLIWRNPHNAIVGTLLHPYSITNNIKDDYNKREILNLLSKATKINKKTLLRLYPNILNRKSILQNACEIYGLSPRKDKIHFLGLESSLQFGGFECGDHGHKGTNGAKGSPNSSAVSFVKRITGHTHTERQFNYVISVGHTTDNPQYARGGMSGWSRSSSIVYKKGQVQSLRFVNGRVRSIKNAFLPRGARYKDDLIKNKKKVA